ncbi:MAG: PhzF family phenazine biosynthesis protein [Acidimicrobiia bacterium]
MGAPIFVVDAFTETAFGGNPAAVCLLDAPAEPEWMQAVAEEMNHSETAFVVPAGAEFGLRWFTPAVEVPLCGHATLASAHVLWDGWLPLDVSARFQTASGLLTCTRAGDLIEMDLPADVPEPVPVTPDLTDALGIEISEAATSRVGKLVAVTDAAAVRAVAPDFAAIARLDAAGVIVTAESDTSEVDFISRYFAPGVGIDEDPVTGAAHCALAPFWAARLGRTELVGYQASERGGTVRCRVDGDRVVLGGHAVTVTRGELLP